MALRGTLIGCGFFAENHLNAWRELDGVDPVAVCDLNAEAAERAAAKFGVPRFYTDAEEMFRAERPDFVDIVTTMASHRRSSSSPPARVAAICQKPFAPTLETRRPWSRLPRAGVP
jgi:predicted dehydrogenase